jgi:hypothetical protein
MGKLLILVSIALYASSVQAKALAQMPSTTDWRGLSPIQSTRMDVERTLGPPDQKIEDDQVTYYYPDVVVYFHFTSNRKCGQKLPYTSWDVTSDTITGIRVVFRHPRLVSEADIDLTKLKKVKGDYDLVGHFYYINFEDGFAIEVGNNYVMGYLYGPGSKLSKLRCEASTQR